MSHADDHAVLFGSGDELPSNHSSNPHLNELIGNGLRRRQLLAGGAALGTLAFLGGILPAAAEAAEAAGRGPADFPFKRRSKLPFAPVAVTRADSISVPTGYRAVPFIPWGTPISGSYPAFMEDASNSAEDQAQQTGMHHDGMHFFPIDGTDSVNGSSVEGLMVTNHEYTTPDYFYPVGVQPGNAQWNLDWVRKSQHAHGVSVRHMRLANGKWEPVLDSPFNRSVNANVAMQLVGPAAGNRLVRTNADPSGTRCFGTFGFLALCGQAFDRVLRHGHYAVPHWYGSVHRVSWRSGRFEQPEITPRYYQPEIWVSSTWWGSTANLVGDK